MSHSGEYSKVKLLWICQPDSMTTETQTPRDVRLRSAGFAIRLSLPSSPLATGVQE